MSERVLAGRSLDRVGPGAATAALAAVSIVAVAAIRLWSDGGTRILGVPFAWAWLGLGGAFVSGFVAARLFTPAGSFANGGGESASANVRLADALSTLQPASLVRVLAVAAALGGAWLLVTRLGFHLRFRDLAFASTPLAVAFAAGVLGGTVLRRAHLLTAVLAAEVVSAWLLVDFIRLSRPSHLYDFRTYIAAGVHVLNGTGPIYMSGPITTLPRTAADDAFIYPPVLLPWFAALAALPYVVAAAIWLGVLIACTAFALRAIGLNWRWALLFLAYPPSVIGLDSGNVALVAYVLYAAGPIIGAGLVLGTLFKPQTVIPALWLVRERRWRALALGLAVLAVLVLVTLPLVGVGNWEAYVRGLAFREQSQINIPYLYGDSLGRWIPIVPFALLAVAVIGAALTLSGRRSLAALGLAAIVASPTLWPHGFLFALPAVLGFRNSTLVWAALGIAMAGSTLWLLVPLGAIAIVTRDWDRDAISDDGLHPLGGTSGPWHDARALDETLAVPS